MTPGPIDTFFEWLSTRPADARTAVAVDGDRLLAEAGLLGKATLTDQTGRTWQLVVFRGDDLTFRLAYRRARCAPTWSGLSETGDAAENASAGETASRRAASTWPVLIVLARSTAEGRKIQVSYLTDILATNEGGAPFDLSIPAVFRRLCPKINFPVSELRRFAGALLERIDAVPKAAAKIIDRWGRPDDWGRSQVAALVLLCRHPDWVLADLWPDETDPAAAVAHGLRILLAVPSDSDDLPIIRQMLQGALQPQTKDRCCWFEAAPDEMAAYLLLRAFALDARLQNPLIQLKGLQIFSLEMPLDRFEPDAAKVIAALRGNQSHWRQVEQRAEAFLTPQRAERLTDLVAAETGANAIEILTSPALLFPYLRRRLRDFFQQAATTWPSFSEAGTASGTDAATCYATACHAALAWTAGLETHPVAKGDFGRASGLRRQCQAAVELAKAITSIEGRLAIAVPDFPHADQLLDWYVSSGHHLLELDAARTQHYLETCEDEQLIANGQGCLFGTGDERSPAPSTLVSRIRRRLDTLDLLLARFVAADAEGFATGPNSIVDFLKSELQGELTPILTGDSDRRIWVLIFDGMRYDTWDAVVQPILADQFTISGQPRFCVLPSYTEYARASLLAGCPPSTWAGEKTTSEASRFAKNIGLAPHEVKQKLRFLTNADTDKARMSPAYTDKSSKPVNVLIYPISDDCHGYRGDLASFNDRIRREILGDPTSGTRGVLDDLLRRVKPDDLVLVVSDHGFVELHPDAAVTVTDAEAAAHGVSTSASVFYRYAIGFPPRATGSSVKIATGEDTHYLCVGRQWLRREGVGTSTRYSHGGLSLSEVIIPAFRLDLVTEKFAAVDLTNLPSHVVLDEDQQVDMAFGVRNRGNVSVDFEVTVRSNLGEQLLAHSGTLAPAAAIALKCALHGRYAVLVGGQVDPSQTLAAIEVRLRHTDQAGKWRDAVDGLQNVPVKVSLKKTKLATDALAGFDDV